MASRATGRQPATSAGAADDRRGAVAADDRHGAVAARDGAPGVGHDRQRRRREEYGGFNFGAAFFGWLVAIAMTALLTALISAAGAAIGLTELSTQEASTSADTIGILGAVLLLVILFLAYFCGGYVAGRMSRFDGARQGLGVWLMGLLLAILLAVAGAIFGAEYNLLEKVGIQPRIPIDEGTLTTGGIIALAAFVIATLGGALIGGKTGERYHRKVDRVGEVA
jgi:hypothetical protein